MSITAAILGLGCGLAVLGTVAFGFGFRFRSVLVWCKKPCLNLIRLQQVEPKRSVALMRTPRGKLTIFHGGGPALGATAALTVAPALSGAVGLVTGSRYAANSLARTRPGAFKASPNGGA